MINIEIPDFGAIEAHSLVLDYTGTLSEFGKLVPEVKNLLGDIANTGVKIYVLTSDSFGTAEQELSGAPVTVQILSGADHHIQKQKKVLELGADGVIAMGNGRNDRLMLKEAKLGICICLREGSSSEAMQAANIVYTSIIDALKCISVGTPVKATLRS